MITVICPTYNSENNIKECLDSVLNQTMSPDEVIISDDGSNDNTIEFLNKYKNFFLSKQIKFEIIENEHCGPGFARNMGISKSRNKWISFLDSDDIWEEEKVERVINEIKNNNEINTVLHLEKFVKIDGSVECLDYSVFYNKNTPLTEQLFKTNFLSTSAVTIQKKLIQKYGCFDINLPNAQDYDLWLKIAPEMKLKIIPNVLGQYVEVETSITRRLYYKKIKSLLIIWYRYRKYSSIKTAMIRLFKIVFSKSWIKSFF